MNCIPFQFKLHIRTNECLKQFSFYILFLFKTEKQKKKNKNFAFRPTQSAKEKKMSAIKRPLALHS